MKKTQVIDLLTTIRKTKVSFIAITVFIALGLAFFGGSSWAFEHTEDSFIQTYRDAAMHTLAVSDPFGLDEEQISALTAIDGVDDAEGFNVVYRFFENNEGVRQQAAIMQMTERIDTLLNVEGELPQAAGQTAVLRSWAEENGVAIGDIIVLEDEDGSDYRSVKSVRSVAQWDGEDISTLAVSQDASGYLTQMSLTVTALVDSSTFLSTNPYAHGVCSGNGLYVDAVFFVAKQEMPPEAFGGYTSVVLYSKELNTTNSFSEDYKARSAKLCAAVQAAIDKEDGELVSDFGASVDALRAQLDAISALTGTSSAQGEALYALLDATRQDLNAQESFSAVMEIDCNSSFLTADNLLGVLSGLRSMLGITFLAIGVLICYSVVSRLVADGSVQIGTRKALGFRKREILLLYISYVCAAMLLGAVLGVVLGVFCIEFALVKVLEAQFTFTQLPLVCNLLDILPVFLIVLAIILAVTIAACAGETRKSAIDLLRGAGNNAERADSVHRSRLFGKLSLLNQTVLVNLLRDKRRVFGMITGIACAVALMAGGITFYVNFTDAFHKQFEEYYHFDYQVCYDASSATASQDIRNVLESYGLTYAEVYSSCCILTTPDGKTNAPTVIVPTDTEELARIMSFTTENAEQSVYSSGLWMSDYYAYAFDADIGDTLCLETLNGEKAEIAIDHYYAYHLSTPAIVMDATIYREAFGTSAAPNSFYVALDGIDASRLSEELADIDGYIYMYNFYDSFLASYSSEEIVVRAFALLFGAMAVLMALMIIVNLLNVYVAEKKNELIILMINGYDKKYAKRYIYADTFVLTLIGVVIGLVAGAILGDLALGALEGTSLRMIHGVSWVACAIASGAVVVLTALICLLTLRKVDRFRLADIDSGK